MSLFLRIKEKILSPLKRKANEKILAFQMGSFGFISWAKMKAASPSPKLGHHFAIVATKKPVYIDLIVNNINSLHYRNPSHEVTVYCDTLCANYLEKKKRRLNYPLKIHVEKIADIASRPWQYYKIEAIIAASKKDQVLIDADSFWHDNPVIDKTKIVLLANDGVIKNRPNEKLLVENTFKNNAWLEFNHYVSGFVSIPASFMTAEIETSLREINDRIWKEDLSYLPSQKDIDETKRLSEELAVNFALQSHHSPETITVFKKEDGPKNRKMMESLYYGCYNQINE